MADLLKYVKPIKNNIPKLSPSEGDTSNPLLKYIDSGNKLEPIVSGTATNNPLLKYIGQDTSTQQVQQKQKVDWADPSTLKSGATKWFYTPAFQDTNITDPNLSWWDKVKVGSARTLKDLSVSIPTIGYGLLQWPAMAHRKTLQEGLKGPQVSSNKRIGISKKYTQPGGIGYLPSLVYNMILGPGQEVMEQLGTQEGRKLIGKSFEQHPLIGPLGTASALALPVMLAKGAVPKAKAYPLAAKKGLYSPLAPPEPSALSKFTKSQYNKFLKSSKGMKFKEYAGLLPEQQKYYQIQYASELAKSEMLSKAGRSDLYTVIKKFTTAEKESFILNLEMAKPKTAQGLAMYKKAGIKIPKPTVNVAKALDLWKKHSGEGLNYMMKQTEGTLFKGGARGKLLTKSSLQKGVAEFKKPLIEEYKAFRAEVKKLGGLSEEAAKPYMNLIPKDLVIKTKGVKASKPGMINLGKKTPKQGLSLAELSKKLKVTPEQIIQKLRKFELMKKEFIDLAVDKMTKKFGYKTPIGEKVSTRQLNKIESARWQPTIQALEKKLGTKLTIKEIRDLFDAPDYYHHAWDKDFQFRQRAYTGPSYSPGIWKERQGAKGYVREPMTSISNYDYQLIKYKALNEFKDAVFNQFGEKLMPKNPAQAAKIQQGILTKYGKGKVLYETPEGQMIKVKADMTLPRTIANEMNSYYGKTSKLEMAFRSYYDPAINSWKIPVLALSPRWIVNNVLGNFILNTMGGVGIGGYLDAMGITVKAFKMMKKAKKSGSPISFVDAFVKQGVPERVAQGIYRGEIMGVKEGLPITKMQKFVKGAKYVPEKVYRFNSAIESFYRTAHYMDKIGKGFNLNQAVGSVNEFLFDYANMSRTQKAIIRRLDPFWAWHKNIIRLGVTYPVNHPQRFMFLQFANKIGTEAYDEKLREAGVNPDDVPAYYRNMFMLPWKDEEGNNFYISLRGLDPLQDIMVNASALTPMLKVPLERHFGMNIFTQKPFSSPYQVYGEDERFNPPLWRHILNNYPQFRVIETIARPYSTYDTGEPMLTKYGEPVYDKSKLLAVLGILGFSVTPRDIDRIYRSIQKDERAKQKRKSSYERRLELFKQNR